MNDDHLDDILRERFGRQADPLPASDFADVRRRERSQTARPRRPFHLRWGLAVAVALLVGSGLGFALGTSSTSSGNAASAPVGLGFLPERGWAVLQSGTSATPERPAVSIAANVPLHPDDDADSLPYSTLLSLPPKGVVILASFTTRGDEWHDRSFPAHGLPLRLRDAAPAGAQVRPEKPLGQYQLRAGVNGHNVDVNVYFGTPRPATPLVRAAQRQLDRLVVRPARTRDRVEERALPMRPTATPQLGLGMQATSRMINRTLRCTPGVVYGSVRELDVTAKPRGALGSGGRSDDISPGYISVGSGLASGPFDDLVFARSRFEERGVAPGNPFPPGVYADVRRCAPARVSVPLSAKGLPGPPVRFDQDADCEVRGRVLVRLRAVLEAPTAWRRADAPYFGARRNVVEAKIAVRSERTRRPIALLALDRGGETRLWVSSGCS